MPFGASMTKPTNKTPTTMRLISDEIVTAATCCTVASSTAPISGPSQVVVPPIIAIAMVLTA